MNEKMRNIHDRLLLEQNHFSTWLMIIDYTHSNILGNMGLTNSVAILGAARMHISTNLMVITMPSDLISDNMPLQELITISP